MSCSDYPSALFTYTANAFWKVFYAELDEVVIFFPTA